MGDSRTVDRRVRRTRAQLRQALTTLMREKELKDISVRELTELADVNRGTFYSHYQDVFDMARQIEQEMFQDLSDMLSAHAPEELKRDLRPVLGDVFTFVQDNSDLCQVMLDKQPQTNFFRRLSRLIYDKCLREWQGLYPLGEVSGTNYYLEFLVTGTVGLVLAWGQSGFHQSPEEMAELANRLIMSGLQSLKDANAG